MNVGSIRAAGCAALLAFACSEGSEPGTTAAPTETWPSGTVLVVEGQPILDIEVDQDSTLIYHLALESTERDLRRKALATLTLPRAIGRVLAGDRRDEVEQEASAELARLVDGSQPMPDQTWRRRGGYGDVGYAIWGTALETPAGSWTPLIEVDGAFVAAFVHQLYPYEIPAGTEVDVEVVEWPYVDGARDEVLESAKDELKLEIIDPEWRLIVPERTQYRMGVHES